MFGFKKYPNQIVAIKNSVSVVYTTLTGDNCKNTTVKSTVFVFGSTMTTMGVFCISLFKISSKWLHCNEYFPEPNWEVDKGGTHSFLEIDVDVGSKDFERSCCWVSRFLNICCEDAKVAFTDITKA
ncbi:hypothetical protein Lal_00004895 [Lupinus albus]|nr:hypothetical protein Lal_00004895 [Lupinus albus]